MKHSIKALTKAVAKSPHLRYWRERTGLSVKAFVHSRRKEISAFLRHCERQPLFPVYAIREDSIYRQLMGPDCVGIMADTEEGLSHKDSITGKSREELMKEIGEGLNRILVKSMQDGTFMDKCIRSHPLALEVPCNPFLGVGGRCPIGGRCAPPQPPSLVQKANAMYIESRALGKTDDLPVMVRADGVEGGLSFPACEKTDKPKEEKS